MRISITTLYIECHYAECQVLFIIMLNVVMLNVTMLSVVTQWARLAHKSKGVLNIFHDARHQMFAWIEHASLLCH
jgi:hypothetical protein